MILRRTQRQALDVARVKDVIADRYYQKRAVGSICAQFSSARRKALLVMATGTGKTRVAIALVDVLQRAGWVKRALFLADRVALVNQAVAAFKAHLPESSPVNLVTEKETEGRVYVCTYPTMPTHHARLAPRCRSQALPDGASPAKAPRKGFRLNFSWTFPFPELLGAMNNYGGGNCFCQVASCCSRRTRISNSQSTFSRRAMRSKLSSNSAVTGPCESFT